MTATRSRSAVSPRHTSEGLVLSVNADQASDGALAPAGASGPATTANQAPTHESDGPREYLARIRRNQHRVRRRARNEASWNVGGPGASEPGPRLRRVANFSRELGHCS